MKTNPNTLVHLIKLAAQKNTDTPALIAPNGKHLTYQNLLILIEHVQHYLNSRGINTKSRVATVLPSTPEAACAFLAISSSCTFAPLNPAYTYEEFERYLSDLNVNALIILQEFDSPVRLVAKKLQIPLLELVPDNKKGAGYFSLIGETGFTADDTETVHARDIAMLLHTSGSTSEPKIVPFQHQAICSSSMTSVQMRNLSSQDRCLIISPLFHLQGLLGIVNLLIVGGSCIYASPFEPKNFIEWLNEFDPTYFAASPTIHQAILAQAIRTKDFQKNPALRFLSSGAAPLPIRQLNALEAIFGVPVIELYAMTETLHISGNPLPPKTRKPGSVGNAQYTEVTIVDHACQSLPVKAIGEIVVQSPWVMTGYINNDQANKDSFCAKGFRTGDLGYFDEEGYLFITGRIKEIINCGGEKISPYEIDHVLLAHPAIKEVVTFQVSHPTLGENIAAAVVVKDNEQVEIESLRQFMRQKLAGFKIPYRIVFSEQIPRGPTGKLQRHKMAGYFANQLAAQDIKLNKKNTNGKLPLTSLQKHLLSIWQELLEIKDIGIHDNFLELGGNSILATQLMNRISEKFLINVPLVTFFETSTIAELSESLKIFLEQGKDKTNKSIKALQSRRIRTLTPFSKQ